MASQGPRSAGAGADNATVGTLTWSNPGNIVSSNDTRATTGTVGTTHYLVASNFGFSIPTNSTIDGIVVEWEKHTQFGTSATDTHVRIVKGGAISATNLSAGLTWSTGGTDRYDSYGSTTQLWGETWTAADINASTFGAALSGTGTGFPGINYRVDHCQITVYYSLLSPYYVRAQSDRRPIWVPNRSTRTTGYESLVIGSQPGIEMVTARGIVPPPRRTSQETAFRVVIPVSDAQPERGWNMATVIKPVQPIPTMRRTQSLMDLGLTIPNGPDAWMTKIVSKRLPSPRLNRGWFDLPTERFAPDIDSWLTMQKQPVQPPLRAGQSQSLFLTLPYGNDPNIIFYRDSRAVQSPARAGNTRFFYTNRDDIANDYSWQLFHRSPIILPPARAGNTRFFYTNRDDIANDYSWQLFHRSPIILPPARANTSRIVGEFETGYPYGFPIQDVKAIATLPVPTIRRDPFFNAIPPSVMQDVPRPGFITSTRGRFPDYTRPSATFTPILETTSTGIMQVGWMASRVMRRPILLIRGPASQLFYAPGLIDTYTRIDNRNSGGAGMSASSTGGSGRARTSTGVSGNDSGNGRPPNR